MGNVRKLKGYTVNKNEELYKFIEKELGESLTHKEKKSADRLSRSYREICLFDFIENELGEKLTNRRKNEVLKIRNLYNKDREKIRHEKVSVNSRHIKRNNFFRYVATAAASIILCLSIVLPIKFNDTSDRHIISSSEEPNYSTDTSMTSLSYDILNSIDGLLLFDSEQFIPLSGDVFVELANEDGHLLSYNLLNYTTIIDADSDEIFTVDYTIRTYKNYTFQRYYNDCYATLEDIHGKNSGRIDDEDRLYEFNNMKVIGVIERFIDVCAFVLNGIPVFYCTDEHDGNSHAFICFFHKGNGYFIDVIDDIFHVGLDKHYIKDKFIPALFQNIK